MHQEKQPDRFRASGSAIADPSRTIKYLVWYQSLVMRLIATSLPQTTLRGASSARSTTSSIQFRGLSLYEILSVFQLDAALFALLEHQRTIRLMSSTNVLSKKPLMRLISQDMREMYICALEKLIRFSSDGNGSGLGITRRDVNAAPNARGHEDPQDEEQKDINIFCRGLERPSFVTESALVALELSPHAGFTSEQRERLVVLLIAAFDSEGFRGKHKGYLTEILAKGEMLYT
jgi:hypothetical protein